MIFKKGKVIKMIIDFHTHTFPDTMAAKVLHKLSLCSGTIPYTNGTLDDLSASMEKACIQYSVNLSVATSASQTASINNGIIASKETYDRLGIIPFGAIHPENEDYKEQLKMLSNMGIKGIKIHPAYQNTDLSDIRYMKIIDEASSLGMIVLTHAGIDIGLYDHNYSSVSQILQVIDKVHPDKFILAHMGNWACWDDVEHDLCGAPVWFDSAFSIGPLEANPQATPTPYSSCTMPDDQFVRISKKHGIDKILFATDSPWQEQKRYIERFSNIGLTKEELQLFFYENAAALLDLSSTK